MRQPQPLPLLDSIRIAAPCPASWAGMEGDDRVRACSLCNQSVFNLSAMTRAEAEHLVRSATSRQCVRLYRRANGTVMTSDCRVGVLRAARRRVAALAGVWACLTVVAFGWFAGRPGAGRQVGKQVQAIKDWIDPPAQTVMGEMCLPGGPPAQQ